MTIDEPLTGAHVDAAAEWLDLLGRAVRLVVGDQFASLPRMQRRLAIGHDRAVEVLDQLEDLGVVGPERVGMSREVLHPAAAAEAVWEVVTAALAADEAGSGP